MDRKRAILFDFDGTLAETVEAGVTVFNELARRYGFLEITDENAGILREKGPRAAMKALAIPMFRVPTVLRALRDGIRMAIPTLEAVHGMRFAAQTLRDMGYGLGIVTSNSAENVRQFLARNQMEYFNWLEAGSGIFGKAAAIKKLVAREGLAGKGVAVGDRYELTFVGDEIRDVEAAKKNRMASVGVTWGLNSREGLASAGPDHIVDTAKELLALFS